ncbi:MAG: MBL fold metallo-hydrolase [Nocardioidaceae bacterium]
MTSSATVSGWTEVADRCFVRRYPYLDVSCTVVIGGHDALVVDTRASLRQGRELAEHVRVLTPLPVQTVVNTHVHFDHLFGNGAFPRVPVLAHESVPVDLPAHETRLKALYEAEPDDPNRDAALATVVVPPDITFSSVSALDLGDRHIELAHLGRGHTGGDVVVRVPDADLVCAGDLVEESAPPGFGSDCYPLEWGHTLESMSELLGPGTVVVPGHGRAVGRDFVLVQRLDVVDVAEQIRSLASSGVAVEDAAARGSWPFPREGLGDAVARGYAQLSPPR